MIRSNSTKVIHAHRRFVANKPSDAYSDYYTMSRRWIAEQCPTVLYIHINERRHYFSAIYCERNRSGDRELSVVSCYLLKMAKFRLRPLYSQGKSPWYPMD